MRVVLQGSFDSGLLELASQLVSIAGAVVLVLILVALGSFAYKSLYGDGIRWPDDGDDEAHGTDDQVRRGSDDTEWKYE